MLISGLHMHMNTRSHVPAHTQMNTHTHVHRCTEDKRMETKIIGYLMFPEIAMSREHG